MRHRVIAVVILALLLFVACRQAQAPAAGVGKRIEAPGGSYTLITANALREMLQDKDFLLVNVHIPYAGEIEPTDLFIPYNEIPKHLDQLPDKAARIVVYCRSGSMSNQAAHELVNLGYTNVYDVEGGMIAWEAAGFPLKKSAQ
jgi:rhodanese-related sulfurtransferase